MSNISSILSRTSLVSSQELSKATEYLASTRDSLLEALNGLSDSQWEFKPAADQWSIGEISEHVVLVEERVHGLIERMPDAPRDERGGAQSQMDEAILAQVPERSAKFEAPPWVLPSHHWSPAETVARFLESRSSTVELLRAATCLRGHVVPHPVFGPWDGYQWILAAAGHSLRHTGQILEIRASSGFPERQAASAVSLH